MSSARHEQPVSKRSSRVYDAHGQTNVGFFLLSANDEQIQFGNTSRASCASFRETF